MVDAEGRIPDTIRSRFASRSADVVLVTVRELRLMLGLLLILFVTSEVWRYIGRLTTARLVILLSTVSAAALLVVVLGLRHTLVPAAVRSATIRVVVEVVTFGATLFVTFVVVGIISVDAGLAAEWSGGPSGVLVSLGIGSPPLVLTRPLLQVAAFLAALGALVFAVEVIADAGTRHTLVHDLVELPGIDEAADDR